MKRTVGSLLLILILLLFFGYKPSYGAEQGRGDIILDAEKVIYDEGSGLAEAEGDSRLRQDDVRIFSHRMEYDTISQQAIATSKPGEVVTLLYGKNRFRGKTLEYDMISREGVMTDAMGDLPAGMHGGTVYIRGKNLDVVPLDSALEKKWIKKRHTRRIKDEEEQIAKWTDASITTCPSAKPHYRLMTKRLVVIPGVRVIAKNPRVYIAEKFLFSYPFDYVVPLHGQKDYVLGIFIPSVVYDSDKGVGYALTGPYAWDTGEVDMAFRYWSDVDFEYRVGVNQRFGRNFSVFANVDYSWEELEEDEEGNSIGEKKHRPQWGARFSRNGWNATLLWSQRENLDIEKRNQEIDGETVTKNYRNMLHREPELTISSPWWNVGSVKDFQWRVTGTWGDYEVSRMRAGEIRMASRTVWELQAQYIGKTGDIRPFWRGQYRKFDYSDPILYRGNEYDYQNVSAMWLGFRTRLGMFDFANAWHIQRTSGRSPMGWDRLGDKEVFYSELGFPVGRDLYLSALSTYDIRTHSITEMDYRLILDQDCSRWEFIYRDDQTGADDDWMSLRFMVKAFPATPLVFGDKNLPFTFPNQGEFRGKKREGVPSKKPLEYDEQWGDDGITYWSDPTRLKETGENPVPSPESGDGTDSVEDGNILYP